jgi:hypothetical protein
MRMRARAKKRLESAAQYGTLDAGRAAREKENLVRFGLTVARFRKPAFLSGARLPAPEPSWWQGRLLEVFHAEALSARRKRADDARR